MACFFLRSNLSWYGVCHDPIQLVGNNSSGYSLFSGSEVILYFTSKNTVNSFFLHEQPINVQCCSNISNLPTLWVKQLVQQMWRDTVWRFGEFWKKCNIDWKKVKLYLFLRDWRLLTFNICKICTMRMQWLSSHWGQRFVFL